jgi:hypothetical protein
MSPSTEQRENRALALELKFLVPAGAGEEVRAWAREKLSPDPNAPGEENDQYQITSLYFDTRDWDVFHRNGSYGRSKYRIRRYGNGSSVFLERKLKTKGFVSKRRSLAPEGHLARIQDKDLSQSWNCAWFAQRLMLRRLQPICQISYQRTARVAMGESGPLRLTIDDSLRALLVSEIAFAGDCGHQPILPERSIIELKFRGEMPVIFKEAVETFKLAPAAISKYRLAIKHFGIAKPAGSMESLSPVYA